MEIRLVIYWCANFPWWQLEVLQLKKINSLKQFLITVMVFNSCKKWERPRIMFLAFLYVTFSRIVLIGHKHYVSYRGMLGSDMTGNFFMGPLIQKAKTFSAFFTWWATSLKWVVVVVVVQIMQLLSTEVTVLNDSMVVDSLTTGCNKLAEVSNHNCWDEGSTLMQASDVHATLWPLCS